MNRRDRNTLIACAIVVVLALGGAVCFVAGGVFGETQIYHKFYQRDQKLMHDVLAGHPEYSSLQIVEESEGYAALRGTVASQDAYSRLSSAVAESFGKWNLKWRLISVNVDPAPGKSAPAGGTTAN